MGVKYKNMIKEFSSQKVESIANVLADTGTGLSGEQIGRLLQSLNIPDTDPSLSKRKRLFNAFAKFQNQHHIGNHIISFVNKAMDPVSYTDNPEYFQIRKDGLNKVLSFSGLTLGDNGKVLVAKKAITLDDALARANSLKATLDQRNVHENVFKYCNAEILQQNYFHAVLEAMKSITMKIRQLSCLDEDGAALVDKAFGIGKNNESILAINKLDSKTLRGEQRGFMSLLKGLYGTIRNPLAHEAKIEWDEMSEQDAVDILTMISLVHRKLDKTQKR